MLQGSLGDFSLAELLGLIAATQKTGQLRLDGDRGSGSLWVDDGDLVAADATRGPGAIEIATSMPVERSIQDIVFELLRFADGTFSFSLGIAPPQHGPAEEIDDVLDAALTRLDEWHGIEAVVPSLLHVLVPVPTLPAEQVTIDQREWSIIVATGERAEVRTVCEALDLDEVAGSRQIKAMVERSLLTVTAPGDVTQATVATVPVAAPVIEAVPSPVVAPTSAMTEAVVAEPTVAEPTVAEPTVRTIPAPSHAGAPGAVEAPNPDEVSSDRATSDVDESDAESDRPPMPTPPSPAEIESFGQQLDEEPFDPSSLVTDEEPNGSLLMRYLKSDS